MKISKTKFEIAKARACKSTADIESSGVPKTTLFMVLSRGEARPETIGKIARALGVDVTDIIDTDD